jgi:hypothetical protein
MPTRLHVGIHISMPPYLHARTSTRRHTLLCAFRPLQPAHLRVDLTCAYSSTSPCLQNSMPTPLRGIGTSPSFQTSIFPFLHVRHLLQSSNRLYGDPTKLIKNQNLHRKPLHAHSLAASHSDVHGQLSLPPHLCYRLQTFTATSLGLTAALPRCAALLLRAVAVPRLLPATKLW